MYSEVSKNDRDIINLDANKRGDGSSGGRRRRAR